MVGQFAALGVTKGSWSTTTSCFTETTALNTLAATYTFTVAANPIKFSVTTEQIISGTTTCTPTNVEVGDFIVISVSYYTTHA